MATHQATDNSDRNTRGVTLRELAALTGGTVADTHQDVTVDSAAIGSADVQPGGLFCAVPGSRVHGATFAADSEAAAVLTDAEGAEILADADLPLLVVDDVRRWMGPVAAAVYGHPSRDLRIIGITGTSGKTTTTYLIERALMAKHSVGIIGTTGTRINGEQVPTKLTTPEAPTMQALLAQMRDRGVTHVVMEVSSHALALGRVTGIDFDVAGFTNLSQDHLDFHPTMEDYFETKAQLFLQAQAEGAELPAAVVCVDDDWGQRLAGMIADSGHQALTVGTTKQSGADWQVTDVHVTPAGRQEITVASEGEEFSYDIGLVGSFNVANSLLAISCVTQLGEDPQAAAGAIADVQVPGRMQAVDAGQPFLAVVDYAHKPGAVAAVVRTLSDYLPSPTGRIGIVLGAGGNRDHDKRPMMGEEAAKVADAVFVTDDNPRDEEPAPIRSMILDGVRKAAEAREANGEKVFYDDVPGRADAIRAAVAWARPGDAIVVAGKGHETGQEVRGEIHPFSDLEELAAALEQRAGVDQQASTKIRD